MAVFYKNILTDKSPQSQRYGYDWRLFYTHFGILAENAPEKHIAENGFTSSTTGKNSLLLR